MYLADTSIWIDILNNNASNNSKELFASGKLGLTSTIYLEVLQGSKNTVLFKKIKQVLLEQKFYYLKDQKESYEQAALIYSKCRKKGITIRASIDCLIAQCAIENDLILLHNDQDFERIASVIPEFNQTIC